MAKTLYIATEENSVDLSAYKDALNQYRTAKEQVKYWTERADELNHVIKAELGDKELALVDGKPYLRQNPAEQVSWAQLKKAEGSMLEPYMITVTKEELDTKLFASAHPEIVAKYVYRRLEVL